MYTTYMQISDCIFCQIVEETSPAHKIWENGTHLAFLSIFPNTDGFSVVIPKKHYDSYVFNVPENVMTELIVAAKKVGRLLDKAFEDVGRTAVMFEGFGVNHLHAKLFPMHNTVNMKLWKGNEPNIEKYFTTYEGYISSHGCPRMSDTKLAEIAEKIRKAAEI